MAWVTGVVLATAFIWLVVGRLFLDYGNPDARPTLYGSCGSRTAGCTSST